MIHHRARLLLWPACALALSLAGCATAPDGSVKAEVLEGGKSKARNAKACQDGQSPAMPFVTGMSQTDINKIATGMQSSGLVMVRYTCDEFYVVPNCAPIDPNLLRRRGYSMVRTSLIKDTKSFKGQAEIKGNFRSLAASGRARVEQNTSIKLETQYIGSTSTGISQVYRAQIDELECAEATHFVKRSQLGAFALDSESIRNMSVGVKVTGAGSGSYDGKSASENGLTGGNMEGCAKDNPIEEKCNVPVQLTLLPIYDGKPEEITAVAAAPSPSSFCPEGQQLSGGRCIEAARAMKAGGFECEPGNQAQCAEQCNKAGNKESCNHLGELLLSQGKLDKAKERFTKACSGDKTVARACANLGDVIMRQTQDLTAATAKFEQACSGGDGKGCYELARSMREGLRIAAEKNELPEDAEAIAENIGQRFNTACDAGYAAACSYVGEKRLADILFLSERVDAEALEDLAFYEVDPGSLAEVVDLVETGCGGGDPRGCYLMGLIFEVGVEEIRIESSMVEATALFERSCKDKEAEACMRLGQFYQEGRVVRDRQSFEKALDLIWKSCFETPRDGDKLPDVDQKMKDPDGCAELAVMFGDVQYRDQVREFISASLDDFERVTQDLLGRSCEEGSARGCFYLAEGYEKGLYGFGRDDANAMRDYTTACRQSKSDACYRLAMKYKTGSGVPQDMDRALEKFRDACNVDRLAWACYELAEGILDSCDIRTKPAECAARYGALVTPNEDASRLNDAFLAEDITPEQEFLKRVFDLYRTACNQQGYGLACVKGGDRIVEEFKSRKTNKLPPQLIEHAQEMYDTACSSLDRFPDHPWYTEAEREKHGLQGCLQLAEVFEKGHGVPVAESEAFFRHFTACLEYEHIDSCTQVGIYYLEGRGIQKDLANAADFLGRICEVKLQPHLAPIQSELERAKNRSTTNDGEKKDKERDIERLKASVELKSKEQRAIIDECKRFASIEADAMQVICDRDGGLLRDKRDACLQAGRLLEKDGNKRNVAKAQSYYNLACEHEVTMTEDNPKAAEEAHACYEAARVSLKNPRSIKDLDAVVKGLENACRDDITEACHQLGKLYLKGFSTGGGRGAKRIAKDADKARGYMEMGCNYGYGQGCLEYAELLTKMARGGKTKEERQGYYIESLQTYYAMCDQGDGEACFNIGKFYLKGFEDQIPADRDRSRVFFDKSCMKGHKPACNALKGGGKKKKKNTKRKPR